MLRARKHNSWRVVFVTGDLFFLQDLHLTSEIDWPLGKPPLAEPMCGFRGEKCISEYITRGVLGSFHRTKLVEKILGVLSTSVFWQRACGERAYATCCARQHGTLHTV